MLTDSFFPGLRHSLDHQILANTGFAGLYLYLCLYWFQHWLYTHACENFRFPASA